MRLQIQTVVENAQLAEIRAIGAKYLSLVSEKFYFEQIGPARVSGRGDRQHVEDENVDGDRRFGYRTRVLHGGHTR